MSLKVERPLGEPQLKPGKRDTEEKSTPIQAASIKNRNSRFGRDANVTNGPAVAFVLWVATVLRQNN